MTTALRSADVGERAAARPAWENTLRAGTKRTLRTWGTATAPLRPLPDFLVIGAKRGGTTSFVDWLRAHPGVLGLFPRAERLKGLYFFDEQFDRGAHWYRSHFPTAAVRAAQSRRLGYPVMTGEGSPYYLFHPLAAGRASEVVPNAQILVLLRDPVERAFSHWKERRRNRTEPLDFADAIIAEAARLAGEESRLTAQPGTLSFAHRHCSYVTQGMYAPMLERWFSAFGRDRVRVWASEEVFAQPQRALDDVFERLGLPGHRLERIGARNQEPSRDLDPGLRAELRARLSPAIRATETVLGRELPWDRDPMTG